MQTAQLCGWIYEFIVAAEVPIIGRLGLVFKILFNGAPACRAADVLSDSLTPATERASPGFTAPVGSEVITLLAVIQRDARFVEFIRESIDGYNDAQMASDWKRRTVFRFPFW